MRADDILDQINEALGDSTVGPDAMRSQAAIKPVSAEPQIWIAPVGTPAGAEGWQPLGHISDVDFEMHIDQSTIDPGQVYATITIDATAVFDQIARLQRGLQAYAEAVTPRLAEVGRAMRQAFEQMQQAGVCDDHGRPLPPRDRPAWQSPYGPPQRRR